MIHSFWIPQLNGKTDAFPNHINFTLDSSEYAGRISTASAPSCAAPSHANMRAVVIAKDAGRF